MLVSPAKVTQLNWREVQGQLSRRTGYVIAALGYLVWFQQLSSQREDPYLLALVFAVSSIHLWLGLACPAPFRPHALLLQVALLWAGVATVYLALGHGAALLFFAAPLILAFFGLGLGAGAVATVASLGLILLQPPADGAQMLPTVFLLALVAGLSAAVYRVLGESLRESWRFNQDVTRLSRELRLRQEEVNKLNKALVTANGLLKRSLRELSLAQQEALDARKLKEEFATTVSHELRTPLNTILGFVEVMQRYPEVYGDVTWTSELRRDISEIQVSARYLSGLVDDILDLARIQALHMPMRREDADLAALIEEAAALAERLLAGNSAVELRLELPEGLPLINVDRVRIQQVVLNLLANACRFTERGHIEVEARLADDEVVVSVSDTGPGIAPEELPRIFDDFHRSGVAPIGRLGRSGSGLGLAIARRFVQMHGGRIWVESRLGEGSTFQFSLPLRAKQVARLDVPRAPGQQPAGATPALVVVGDDHGAAFLARRLEGYELLPAATILEARGLVYDRHPHAVLIDMPLESGERSFGWAPRILPEPVPVLSCSLPGSRRSLADDLFADWLVKPVDSERLRTALSEGIGVARVLVVDDDASFAHLIERYLQTGAGAPPEVVHSRDGETALALAREFQPDLVLLDMALPGIDGWEVARLIRESHLNPPPRMIAVTALDPTQRLAGTTRTFAITKSAGFTEAETLQLIQSCLANLNPAYSFESPAAEP